jgi:hypothetical protein
LAKQLNQSANDKFYDDMLKGNAYKDMIKVILQKSGYTVYPYGYESSFSDVKSKFTKESRNLKTVRRIRSSPDLLVYDDQKNDLTLVEVKMRGNTPPKIRPNLIENIKEFWNDSILVIVVPEGNVFYAQRISELEIKQGGYPLSDFKKFQDIFKRVSEDDILHYKGIALQNMKTKKEIVIENALTPF